MRVLLVREAGVEPATRTPLRALAPEASESTNSTTRASGVSLVATRDMLPWCSLFVNTFFQKMMVFLG